MKNFVAIFLGGGLGSSLRWFIGILFQKYTKDEFPWATLFVNVCGSFILGFLTYYLMEKLNVKEELRLFATIGFCGGFTTFSTFALEHFNLISTGEIFKSTIYIIYIILSIFLSILAVILGVVIAKWIN